MQNNLPPLSQQSVKNTVSSLKDFAYRGYTPPPSRYRRLKWLLAIVLFISIVGFLIHLGTSHNQHPADRQTVTHTLTLPSQKTATKTTEQKLPSSKTVTVKSGENLSTIFKRLGLSAKQMQQLLQTKPQAKILRRIHVNDTLRFQIDTQHTLQQLVYEQSPLQQFIFTRQGKRFEASQKTKRVETRETFTTGKIKDSLFVAGQKAGLSDRLIMKLANIFGWDIDFALNIRPGDQFSLIYQESFADSKQLHNGHIIAAEFINRGKLYQAVRYTDAKGHADYYTPDGLSMRKEFLRTPVEFSRISSRFTLGRMHPILHRIRAHRGVDYVAPRGTPVKASGDGKVIFLGRKGGYGNAIILKHGHQYNTLYAHLAHFRRGLRTGKSVRQGQIIGYVGSTGLATGPHLHYEFRVNGVHRNPLTVRLPKAKPIAKKYKRDFLSKAKQTIAKLEQHKHTHLARITP